MVWRKAWVRRKDEFWNEFWKRADLWEFAAADESRIIPDDSDETWELMDRANELKVTDPEAAFAFYMKAADAGSVWSMEKIGWLYWTGTLVGMDLHAAVEAYDRAMESGSLLGIVYKARILSELGRHAECEQTLQRGIEANFAPAYFWMAKLRYEQRPTRETAKQMRPLLEYAAKEGHPTAIHQLDHWMVRGKLGLVDIPRGLMQGFKHAWSYAVRDN